MFMICGYDFCKDENTLNPTPLSSSNYNFTMLKNGIFSHWYVTNDGEYSYSPGHASEIADAGGRREV